MERYSLIIITGVLQYLFVFVVTKNIHVTDKILFLLNQKKKKKVTKKIPFCLT